MDILYKKSNIFYYVSKSIKHTLVSNVLNIDWDWYCYFCIYGHYVSNLSQTAASLGNFF